MRVTDSSETFVLNKLRGI